MQKKLTGCALITHALKEFGNNEGMVKGLENFGKYHERIGERKGFQKGYQKGIEDTLRSLSLSSERGRRK